MGNISSRIMEVIKNSGLTQTEFATRLNISQGYISKLAKSTAIPSDRTIADICREFGISETWLRTGEGDMLVPVSAEEQISEFVADVLTGRPDIRRRVISVLARLDPEDWDLIERLLEKFAGENDEAGPD